MHSGFFLKIYFSKLRREGEAEKRDLPSNGSLLSGHSGQNWTNSYVGNQELLSGLPQVLRALLYGPSSAAFPVHKQRAGSEIEQPGHEQCPLGMLMLAGRTLAC